MFISTSKDKAFAEQMTCVENWCSRHIENLNDIYSCGDKNVSVTELFNAEIYSPYSNLGVSIASNYVNVRSQPSTESEIVGKLYNGCAAEILEWLEGDWVKIVSGDVEGYIASNYLATGKEAEKLVDKHAEKYATVVRTQTLRVREEQSTESRTLELIPLGERYPVIKEYDEWAEILISTDDQGDDFTGFVHKDYVEIEVIFKKAISIEEEQRIIRQQREAERAEAERLQRLAEEEERRRIEEARRQEEARKAAEEKEKAEQESKNEGNSSGSSGSSLGIEIANYAQKFVGNRYVWGGTSLTKGELLRFRIQYISNLDIISKEYQGSGEDSRTKVDGNVNPVTLYSVRTTRCWQPCCHYIGNDKIVHAASSRQSIIISQYNYRKVVRKIGISIYLR